jgi:acetamidase/formamidase
MGLAPASRDFVDSIPPVPSDGNLGNKRIGIGTSMYYPGKVAGGLHSVGYPHAAQGDSEPDGTGIETSLTGKLKLTVIKQANFTEAQEILDVCLGETEVEWIVHGRVNDINVAAWIAADTNCFSSLDSFTETDCLETLSESPGDMYGASSIDKAMMNTFTQTRKFVMAEYSLTEAEASTIITGVNFGMTQLVDGNWGVHAIVTKAILKKLSPSRALETRPLGLFLWLAPWCCLIFDCVLHAFMCLRSYDSDFWRCGRSVPQRDPPCRWACELLRSNFLSNSETIVATYAWTLHQYR